MAGTATPKTVNSADRRVVVAVAYSGGRDSTALLHAAVAAAAREQASIDVLAFHIHHGLSDQADAWQAHCEQQCTAWSVQLVTRYLSGKPAAAQSVEAWAREQRYAALAEMAQAAGADLLLLAHHRRDQAETLLLQALRGAGIAGLAGMPQSQWRDGICWARPWLDQPREAIEAYIAEHGLTHIEDDSNADPRFARNRLRLTVWPGFTEAFPQAEASLAQAASWAQEALALQQELAEIDLAGLADERGLDLVRLFMHSPARAGNALRAWLLQTSGRAAPATLIERLRAERQAGEGAWPCAGGLLHLYRGRLSWRAGRERPPPPSQLVNLDLPGIHAQADWGGAWQVETVVSGGVPIARTQDLTLRARRGGEQFQRAPRSALRSLKKAYQEAGVPAWERDGPLLFSGPDLLFAAGLGLDARMLAAPGEPQLCLSWRRDLLHRGS